MEKKEQHGKSEKMDKVENGNFREQKKQQKKAEREIRGIMKGVEQPTLGDHVLIHVGEVASIEMIDQELTKIAGSRQPAFIEIDAIHNARGTQTDKDGMV